MNQTLWTEYGDLGLVVWAIDSGESFAAAENFATDYGLDFPVLVDQDGAVFADYTQQAAFYLASYPQDWLIGADGRVVYLNNRYEPDELEAAIRRELGLE